jgi:hypothetical protein
MLDHMQPEGQTKRHNFNIRGFTTWKKCLIILHGVEGTWHRCSRLQQFFKFISFSHNGIPHGTTFLCSVVYVCSLNISFYSVRLTVVFSRFILWDQLKGNGKSLIAV